MNKSKTLWVMIAFFTWSALKSAGSLYGAQSVTDYALLSSIGLGFLFYLFNVPLMLGEAALAYLLFKQRASAFIVGTCLIAAEILNGIFVSLVAFLNPEKAKVFYIASREARGLTVRQESIDAMVSLQGIGLTVLAFVALYAIIYFYLRRVRPELSVAAA